MYGIWNCLQTQHDWRLVLAAALVCLLTSLTAISLYQRARDEVTARNAWVLTAGVVTGGGIWSTHCIAMLAYLPGFKFDYDVSLTVVSLVAAAAMTTLGFWIAARSSGRWQSVMGGAVIGCGIACMHFIGMASLSFVIVWHYDIVAASVVLAVALAAAAMTLARCGECPRNVLGSSILLTLAITGHHFVAMGAIGLVPVVSLSAASAVRVSPIALSLAIAAATIMVTVAGMVAATNFGGDDDAVDDDPDNLDSMFDDVFESRAVGYATGAGKGGPGNAESLELP